MQGRKPLSAKATKILHMPYPAARVYKRSQYFTQQLSQSSLIFTNMRASVNLIETRAASADALQIVNGVRESPISYTLAAVALAIVALAAVLSGFEGGRKALQRIVWFLDGMLGGAPHTITLPGPPGLPLVGNLIEVSYS
jgi:hypothetical protein